MSRDVVLSFILLCVCAASALAQGGYYNTNWWQAWSNDAAMIFLFRETSGTNIANYGTNGVTASWVISNATSWARIQTSWGAGAISNWAFGNYGYIGYLPYTNSITLSAWVYGAHTNPTSSSVLIGAVEWGDAQYMSHALGGFAPSYIIGIFGRGSIAYNSGWRPIAPQGAWTHIASTYCHTSGTMRLYANGAEVYATNFPPGGCNYYHPWAIGREWRTAHAPYWLGAFGEIAVWTRPLSSSEVYSVFYESGGGTSAPPAAAKTSILPLYVQWQESL